MKKIAFMLLAATFGFAACKKQQNTTPATTQITEAGFKGSKATISGLHFKKSDEGLELDYDLVVKEVSANKYEAAIKINGVKLNGQKMNGYKSSAIFGVVLAVNTSKESKEPPLDIELKADNTAGSDKTIIFPAFEYKGDLDYELLNVTTSITINGGNFQIYDNANFRLFDEDMSVKNGGLKTDNGTVIFTEGIDPVFIGKSTVETNFSLLLKDSKAIMEDKTTVFVLPSGHTITQAPELAKVVIEEEKDGTYGYVTVTITGDPARYITSISYQPCTEDGTTKDPKEEPVMKFEATHFNEQNGVQRFKSTQTWAALYHRGRAKFHRGCMQHWHGSTRVDVMPKGEVIYRAN